MLGSLEIFPAGSGVGMDRVDPGVRTWSALGVLKYEQCLPFVLHLEQEGRASSHLTFLSLQSLQPYRTLQIAQYRPPGCGGGNLGSGLKEEKISYLFIPLLIPPSHPRGAGIQATGSSMLANVGAYNDIGGVAIPKRDFL